MRCMRVGRMFCMKDNNEAGKQNNHLNEDPSKTSYGYKGNRIIKDNQKENLHFGENSVAGRSEVKEEEIFGEYGREYVYKTDMILVPVITIDEIMKSRYQSYGVIGFWGAIAAGFYSYDYKIVTMVFCFLASSPIVYLYRTRQIMMNKILEIQLIQNKQEVVLRTAYKTIEAKIEAIKAKGDFLGILGRCKDKFIASKDPNFEMPADDIMETLGETMILAVTALDGSVHRLVIDMDYMLYRVDNFYLLSDILMANTGEVTKYVYSI